MRFFIGSLVALLAALAVACSGGSESSNATPTPRAAATTVEAAASPTAETAATPSATPEPSATAEPTPEPTATPEPTEEATAPPAPTSPPAPTAPPVPAGVQAPIKSNGFPYQLTVSAGSTVVWVNNDPVPHDVTANDDSWSSGLLAPGASYSRTFTTPGKYPYVCRVHPYMTAVLIVE